MDPDNSIPAHYNRCSDHQRIVLTIGPGVAHPRADLDSLKHFIFDDGREHLKITIGCGDVISMTQDVNGTIPMIDSFGNTRRWKHAAKNVNGWLSVVLHFNNQGRVGESSFVHEGIREISVIESSSVEERGSSVGRLLEQSAWRIVEGSVEMLRLLFQHGLIIYGYPFDQSELQTAVNTIISDGLFVAKLNKKSSSIPKLSTGGPKHSSRVCNILRDNTFFDRFISDTCRDFPSGTLFKFFVNSYDNSISHHNATKHVVRPKRSFKPFLKKPAQLCLLQRKIAGLDRRLRDLDVFISTKSKKYSLSKARKRYYESK